MMMITLGRGAISDRPRQRFLDHRAHHLTRYCAAAATLRAASNNSDAAGNKLLCLLMGFAGELADPRARALRAAKLARQPAS